MGTQKSYLQLFNTKGSYTLKMTGGFQIWPQNLNRKIFDPLFGQKPVENWISPVSTVLFVPQMGSNVVRCKI